MRTSSQIIAVLLLFVPITLVAAAGSPSQNAWFYLTADKPRWCTIERKADARAASKSDAFASGRSAWLRFHDNRIDTVVFTTASEDAYAEDTYKFGSDLRVTSVKRLGHYVSNPLFNVSFTLDRMGNLRLTRQAKIVKWKEENAGHETYFVDWKIYRGFADLPFSHLITLNPKITFARPCSRRLLHQTFQPHLGQK